MTARRRKTKASVPIRRQKPVKGGRDKVSACMEHRINTALRDLAARENVSVSYAQSVITATGLGIHLEDWEKF